MGAKKSKPKAHHEPSSSPSPPPQSKPPQKSSPPPVFPVPIPADTVVIIYADDNTKEKYTGPVAFNKEMFKIFITVVTSNKEYLSKPISGAWIAVNTNGVAPDNFEIAKVTIPSLDLSDDTAKRIADVEYTGDFSLSRPTNGWPVGSYRTDIYLGNDVLLSVEFTIS